MKNKGNLLVSFYVPSLAGGGGEKFTLNLIRGFIESGIEVELIVNDYSGPLLELCPSDLKVLSFGTRQFMPSVVKLSNYLKSRKPYALISSLNHSNTISVAAKILAFTTKTKLILVVHTNISLASKYAASLKSKFMSLFMFFTYWAANFVVCVSKGVGEDVSRRIPYMKKRVKVIYNPVLTEDLAAKAKEATNHPWFLQGAPPVIIAIGRLRKEKDFATLMRAFVRVREEIDARLVILGEGEERRNLEKLAERLNISDCLWMPGFEANPYKYLKRAAVFVLSSLYEGLPMVIIEALYFGVKVVSTDCKYGPREILKDGRLGKLVPVGDYISMSAAIKEALKNGESPPVTEVDLRKYTIEYCTEEYLRIVFADLEVLSTRGGKGESH